MHDLSLRPFVDRLAFNSGFILINLVLNNKAWILELVFERVDGQRLSLDGFFHLNNAHKSVDILEDAFIKQESVLDAW